MKKTVIYIILLLTVFLYWILSPNFDYIDDPYIITMEYDCREVSMSPSNYSGDVVDQCKIVVEEINASKTNKGQP